MPHDSDFSEWCDKNMLYIDVSQDLDCTRTFTLVFFVPEFRVEFNTSNDIISMDHLSKNLDYNKLFHW